MGGGRLRKIKPRALGASARQPRARCEIDAAILTRIQAPFEGQSEGNPEQNGGEVLGGNGTKKRKHRRPRRGKKHPPAPRRARDRPRVGILSVAPAQPPAHRRYQRLFRRTIPASPPLDSPVSLLNRFLRNSSNICIMCSRFPRPPPPRSRALTHSHTHTHRRTPEALLPAAAHRPAGPCGVPAPARRWPGPLTHSLAPSPGRWRGRPRPAAGSPRAAPGRRSHASSTWAGERRARRARSAESRAERGHGRSGSRG